ncbi:hypothetical protein AB0D14_32700 [Streptomyces sp. NPDC048484]|uniref:hypothetical protein n=1 Tax=Streptomyces sp. NPDC048484 TaxID=3155146 RepID=UPI00342F7AF5
MSLTDDAFIDARLAFWTRHMKETAARLRPAQTGPEQTGPEPADLGTLLDQLVAVHNLSSGLVADLRQSADGSLATTDAGRDYLARLGIALAHSNRAATHLSTAVSGLADAHRPGPRPGTAAPAESQLGVMLGHDAALRSLRRALDAVTSPLADAQPGTRTVPAPSVVEQHQRPAETSTRPVRRRP